MSTPLLVTKFYAPVKKAESVLRLRLLERLDAGVGRRLTLLSASAGAGKSTLLGEWIRWSGRRVAWLTADEELGDPLRFLTYVVGGLQTLVPGVGAGLMDGLMSPFPPPLPAALAALVNELAEVTQDVVLVLDDYHRIESPAVDDLVTFLVENLPSRMHLIVGTREDPSLPLARWRARGHLTELRMADLRFSNDEAQAYLHNLGCPLSESAVVELQTRTEGWAAGLQMAALSLAGSEDPGALIRSFTGSHRFVLDYLIEEVLKTQPAEVQTFLLTTAWLDRFCAPLCDFVLEREGSQEVLMGLEGANLFLIPLDAERRWYRYHQLFADMLRQRGNPRDRTPVHARASRWLGSQGWGPEAFRHAVAAPDVDQAERVIGLITTTDRATVAEVLRWLDSLPAEVLNAHPLLLLRKATLRLAAGQTQGVEEALAAAEAGFAGRSFDGQDELLGQIATSRSTLAVTQYRPQEIFVQAQRALGLLGDDSLTYRFMALCGLGFARLVMGDRVEAAAQFHAALLVSRRSGDRFSLAMASTSLGQVRELANQLPEAAEDYRGVLALLGPHPQPYASEASLGLARIHYQWNDLDAAERWGRQSLDLAQQYDPSLDRFVFSELFLVKLSWARREPGTRAALARVERLIRERGFLHRLPEWAALQVEVLVAEGEGAAATALAEEHRLVPWTIRLGTAQGKAAAVLPQVVALRDEARDKGWADEHLRALILEALAHQSLGDLDAALAALKASLILAEPAGLVRVYLDEGPALRELLAWAGRTGICTGYVGRLLAAFGPVTPSAPPRGPLSHREWEVLKLVSQGLSNQAIGAQLFVALDTVKGHNRRIFEKLNVSRRTQAIARARELGLL